MLRDGDIDSDDSDRAGERYVCQQTPDGTDTRFRALLGDAAWFELPEPVRRRFSKSLGPGDIVVYDGRVAATELSRAGRILAGLARIIGSPLPRDDGATGPSRVTVTESADAIGQTWTRSYTRRAGPPQVIVSMKCFRGPTGLEEHVGAGIGMELRVSVESGSLVFRSGRYIFAAGPARIRLPRWLSPGLMEVVHSQQGDGSFAFRLTLTHPWFGNLLHQLAFYRDT